MGKWAGWALAVWVLATPSPAVADKLDRLELARRIIATESLDVEMVYFEESVPYFLGSLTQTVTLSEEEQEGAVAVLREEYQAALAIAREHRAEAYARVFNESELAGILAFYESPIGRRFSEEELGLYQESVAMQNVMNAAVLQHALERILAEREGRDY
jgi:hypothetical protein